jgi:hypothetical protein
MAESAETAPSPTDINALRSAQLRVSKQQRQNRMFGRTLLAFVVVGAVIASALIFGRSYLFPTGWDATLTPIVDAIQEATGAEFDQAIALEAQPADEYASNLLEFTLGSDWVADVPQWRALGIVEGDVSLTAVAAALADRTAAFYDPEADIIFESADRTDEELRPALELALLDAMQHQLRPAVNGVVETSGFRLTGVSTPQSLTLRAADNYVVSRTAGELFAPATEAAAATEAVAPTPEAAAAVELPAPIAYQLAAVDLLGESILTATGVDPATLQLGSPYSDVIFGVFGDSPVNAPSATLRTDEQAVADSIALGVDDWSLVWGARLPESTIDQLARIITADSYRPTDRGGQTCFVAVFQTANEADGASLFSAMQLWAQRAAVESQALATQLEPSKVHLEACDPGAGAVINVDPETGGRLVARQSDRFLG